MRNLYADGPVLPSRGLAIVLHDQPAGFGLLYQAGPVEDSQVVKMGAWQTEQAQNCTTSTIAQLVPLHNQLQALVRLCAGGPVRLARFVTAQGEGPGHKGVLR